MRTHGTYACYVWGPEPGPGDGCRCGACKAANSRYEADRARQIAPAYVGASTARTHVRELMAAGVGLKTIAKVSGVGHGTLWKLIYGVPGRGPTKRVRPTTESRRLPRLGLRHHHPGWTTQVQPRHPNMGDQP